MTVARTALLAGAALVLGAAASGAVLPGGGEAPAPAPGPVEADVPVPEPADGSLPPMAGAPVPTDPVAPAAEGYVSPTGTAPRVVRAFVAPAQVWSAGHRGADLALAAGAPVRSAGAGTVAFAGTVVDRPVVSVVHADGLRTTYEPVRPVVSSGQRVAAGEVLGHLAAPGHCSPEACLHWGARRGPDRYLDPMTLLRPVVRLLPG